MTAAERDRDAGARPAVRERAVERAYRQHWSRLLALLAAQYRRLDLAEDCLQEAFVAAATHWADEGEPANPAAWLLTTARRRIIDRLRSESAAERRLPRLIVDDGRAGTPFEETVEATMLSAGEVPIEDERLRLLFASCHPALAAESRAALTLRFVGGLTVTEVARLFVVSEATMAARLTRAKKKIAAAGIPFRVPDRSQLDDRLDVVLTVLYLMFTEGYAATAGTALIRTELASESIRLVRLVDELLPGHDRVSALLALMLLQHARRDARLDRDGRVVLLPDQRRDLWHRGEIAEALALLATMDAAAPEPYLLQARIAAEHGRAGTAADTDWATIAALYAELEAITGSPVVRLNRAVAEAEAFGAEAGLALLEGLDDALPRSHRLPAVRGELLLRLGEPRRAASSFTRALELVRTDQERAYLLERQALCSDEL